MIWTAPLLAMAISAVVLLGALTPITPWLRRIHSVQVEGGVIVLEESPDGRLANPYRTYTKVSIPMAISIGAMFLALIVAVVALLSWLLICCCGRDGHVNVGS